MLQFLARRAVPLTVGFLVGIAVSAWIDPQTEGGFVLILLTFMAMALAIASMAPLLGPLRARAPLASEGIAQPSEDGGKELEQEKPSENVTPAKPVGETPTETRESIKPPSGAAPSAGSGP